MTETKYLIVQPNYLLNERTFLAWPRTSLALIGLGFVVSRFGLFLRELGITTDKSIIARPLIHPHSSLLGISMVFLGAALIIYALKNYLEKNKAIQRGAYISKNSPIYALTIGVVISIVILAFYLLLL
jgi:putative membrane protein